MATARRRSAAEVIARARAFPAGHCPDCGYWLADVPHPRRPDRPLACVECWKAFGRHRALAGYPPAVTLLDWDRAAWQKQRADAELAEMDAGPAVDAALARILARVEARRKEAESLRAELAALGVAVVRLADGSGRLRAAAGVVGADLAAKCREFRDELLSEG
jgi:hypothetical protein